MFIDKLKHWSLQSSKSGSPIEKAVIFILPIEGPVIRLANFQTQLENRVMFYLGIDQYAKQLTINLRGISGGVVQRRQVSTGPEKVL